MKKLILLNNGGYVGAENVNFPVFVDGVELTKNSLYSVSREELTRVGFNTEITDLVFRLTRDVEVAGEKDFLFNELFSMLESIREDYGCNSAIGLTIDELLNRARTSAPKDL